MVMHLSQFNLIYPDGDPRNDEAIRIMKEWGPKLPEAKSTRLYRQTDDGNPFKYCIVVDFGDADTAVVNRYLNNPVHDQFCEEVWFKHVKNQLNTNIFEY